MEYGLVVALLALVGAGAVSMLQDRAADRYEQSAAGITEVAGVVIEAPDDGSTEGPPDSGTGSASMSAEKCTGPRCSFELTDLPPGATVAWATDPGSNTGAASTFSFEGADDTTYTVTATISPGGQTISRTVVCKSACKVS
ncbi:MAG: hypothetical protein ACRDZU_13535 [Acidimicrobiales bacterium]